jgi:2,3-bisphosphoglycerate-independent phosphoglycerate mutase
MNIFGYNPLVHYDGRGSFESMGTGMDMQVGDIAFKSNFAYINVETNVVERRRVDRTFPEWGIPLCDLLNNVKIPGFPEHTLFCKHATEHRCGITISGPRLSSNITGTDPLKDNLPRLHCEPLDTSDKDAIYTCEVVEAANTLITKTLLEAPLCV